LTLILLPFLLTFLLGLFSRPYFCDLHPYLWGEGKIVETVQFLLLLVAGFLSLRTAWLAAVFYEPRTTRLFYLLFGLGMLFIAGEEIAWGQQFLDFRTPAFLQGVNAQNEFTLHNFGPLQARSDLLNLLYALAGLLGISFRRHPHLVKIATPVLLIPWFVLILALAIFGIGFDSYLGDRPFAYPAQYVFHIQTENAELLIALTGILYPWLNGRLIFKDVHLPQLAPRDVTPPLAIFPLKPVYFYLTTLSGLACLAWLVAIPGEASNRFLLGLSHTRFAMVAAGAFLLLFLSLLHYHSIVNPSWRQKISTRLNRLSLTSTTLWSFTLVSILFTITTTAIGIAAYTQDNPTLTPILLRLSPGSLWVLILSLQALHLTLPRLLPLARSNRSNLSE
jgi:hypothetical protein